MKKHGAQAGHVSTGRHALKSFKYASAPLSTSKPRERHLLVLPLFILAAIALAACSNSASTRNSTPSPTISLRNTSIGTILVNGDGHTLYAFSIDTAHKSNCPAGACTALWPPLEVSGKPILGTGVHSSLVGKIRRPSGHYQLTYGGHPLYTYTVDSSPGETHGEALEQFGGVWYAVSQNGHEIKHG